MAVYIVAIVEALAYLGAVPVCGAFCLSVGDALRFGAGIGAFQRRAALRRARRDSLTPKKKPRGDPKRMWRTVAHLRGAELALWGRLDLGDAAATALACGALDALATGLGSHAGRVRVDVRPRFSGGLAVELRGMIRVRVGQIIGAMISSQTDSMKRRISKWTNTRLRA